MVLIYIAIACASMSYLLFRYAQYVISIKETFSENIFNVGSCLRDRLVFIISGMYVSVHVCIYILLGPC